MKLTGAMGHLGRMVVATMSVCTAALAIAVMPASAAAGVSVSPSTAAPGGTVTISGSIPTSGTSSCPAGDPVTIISLAALFPPDGFGPQVPRNASGGFQVSYTIPSSTAAGSYTVGVRCGGANTGVGTTLNVLRGAPRAGLGGASRSGGDAVPWLAGGSAALVVAAGLGVVGMRRRRPSRR